MFPPIWLNVAEISLNQQGVSLLIGYRSFDSCKQACAAMYASTPAEVYEKRVGVDVCNSEVPAWVVVKIMVPFGVLKYNTAPSI